MLRFLLHTVLASWVAVTAVVVATALQWFTARATAEVKVERALIAHKEANDNSVSDSWQDLGNAPQQQEAAAEMRRNYNRLVLKSESANEEMIEAIYLERTERKYFLMQIALWGRTDPAGERAAGRMLAERQDGWPRLRTEIGMGDGWPGSEIPARKRVPLDKSEGVVKRLFFADTNDLWIPFVGAQHPVESNR